MRSKQHTSSFRAYAGEPGLSLVFPAPTGEPNAQTEDQIGREKALQGDRHRQGAGGPRGQTSRHDQADQEADPPVARRGRDVQDRRRAHQEVLAAERLTSHAAVLSAHRIPRSKPWLASNGASRPTPSTRKSSRPPKAFTAGARTPSASPNRRLRRPTSTRSATA